MKDVSEDFLNKMIKRAAKLKKVSADEYSGWAEFILLLEDYCEGLLEYKKDFNLANATDEEIQQLKLHDRDVWLISNFIRQIPSKFVTGVEERVKQREQEEGEKEPEE